MKECIFFLAVAINISAPIAAAVSWETTPLSISGDSAGDLLAVSTDSAGRVHTVFSLSEGTSQTLVYRLRENGSSGFSDPEKVRSSDVESDHIVHLDLAVTLEFSVQLATVDGSGNALVFELANGETTWTEFEFPTSATPDTTGGISIIPRRLFDDPRSQIAYTTITKEGTPGGIDIYLQNAPGAWGAFSPPLELNAGEGLAPVLVDFNQVGRTFVVSYSSAKSQIRAHFYNPVNFDWSPPETIAGASEFTRPDAAKNFDGDLVAAFRTSSGSGAARTTAITYATRSESLGGGSGWTTRPVSQESEIDRGAGEDFAGDVDLALDAAGAPVVAYSRFAFEPMKVRSLDVRVRRGYPGAIDWPLDIIESFGSHGFGFYPTRGLSLHAGLDGDLALLFERDRNAAGSEVIFAIPDPAPWTLRGAPGLSGSFAQSFAPAIAAGPGGHIHIVAGTATGDNPTDPPVTYGLPTFVSLARDGSVAYSETLPSSFTNPHVSHALTTDSGGRAHVLSLRLSDDTSTSGDLLYFRQDAPGIPGFSPGRRPSESVLPGAIALGVDAQDRLYAAYNLSGNSSGRIRLQRLVPGALSWEILGTLFGDSSLPDLAVRPDGGYALSFYGKESGAIQLFSNIDFTTGLLQDPEISEVDPIVDTPGLAPLNTSVVILPDGFPRVAIAYFDALQYFKPDASLLRSFSPFVVANPGFLDGTIDLVAEGNTLHAVSHNSLGLRHLEFSDADPANPIRDDLFATPGYALNSLGHKTLSLTTDGSGAPVLATGLRATDPGSFFSYDLAFVARPGDAWDHDADGLPVLFEAAFCQDPRAFSPSFAALVGGRTELHGTGVDLAFRFPSPAVDGAFDYDYEASSDLTGWFPETTRPNIAPVPVEPLPRTDRCRTRQIGFRYAEPPRRFARLRVSRDR